MLWIDNFSQQDLNKISQTLFIYHMLLQTLCRRDWVKDIWKGEYYSREISFVQPKNNTPLLYFVLTNFLHWNRYLCCTLIFSSLIDIYFLSWNWSLWRKTSTVVYSEMWLNRVIVHWLFLFDNLILYWVMFELLLFL